jgi:hypothetical protein
MGFIHSRISLVGVAAQFMILVTSARSASLPKRHPPTVDEFAAQRVLGLKPGDDGVARVLLLRVVQDSPGFALRRRTHDCGCSKTFKALDCSPRG